MQKDGGNSGSGVDTELSVFCEHRRTVNKLLVGVQLDYDKRRRNLQALLEDQARRHGRGEFTYRTKV